MHVGRFLIESDNDVEKRRIQYNQIKRCIEDICHYIQESSSL